MPRPALARSLIALALFAVAHSALAALPTKRQVRQKVGPHAADGLYRAAYVAVATGSSGLLAAYLWRLPDRPLYRASGLLRVAMVAGQAVAACQTLAVIRRVGPARFAGWPQVRAYLAGDRVEPPVVAQHPIAHGPELAWGGPFRRCRHPNNAFPLLVWWLSPTMTAKWAAVGAGAGLYMLLGSWHEEHRLASAYGARFDRYRQAVPHLLVPLGQVSWPRAERHAGHRLPRRPTA